MLLFPLAVAFALAAQEPPPPAPPPPPEPSAAELAEIERSLAADAAARHTHETATDQTSANRPAPGGAAPGILNPDLALILDAALAAFSTDEPRQTGAHDPAKNGFTLQQLELSAGKAVDPYFRFDAAVVFSPFGVEVEEAFATAYALPGSLQARAGLFLTRFGRLNPTHLHAWEFIDQPFFLGRVFGGEGNRGVGAEVSWLVPLPWYLELLASATDAAGAATARSFWGSEDLGVKRPQDVQLTLALKQFFPFGDPLGLLLGISGAFGPNPSGYRNRTEIYGADLYLKYRPLTGGSHTMVALQAEVLARRRQAPSAVLDDVGGYAQLVWRFARRFTAAVRHEYGSPVSGGAADYLDPLWPGHRNRASVALTFLPTEFSRVRLQLAHDSTTGDAPTVLAGMLALEVLAGAHGAHTY